MPDFAYLARDAAGTRTTGTVSAGSLREAAASLAAQDLFPIELKLDRPLASPRSRRVSAQRIATAYSQLAALLRSGVPLLRTIDVVRRQTSSAALVAILDDVYAQVEEGQSLADALARHPKAFDEMAVSVLRAGGEGGFLEDALDRVAHFTEQQDDLKSRVLGALAYPIFLAVLGTVVVNILVIFFVPRFESLFSRLRETGELPFVTDWLLGTSRFLQTWGFAIVAALLLGALLARSRLATEQGKWLVDRLKFRLPWAGPVYRNLAVARFCRVLGTMLRAGVPILRALEISSGAAGNRVLAAAIRSAGENISAGQSLAAPLAASGQFPTNVIEMITVAEQANNLEVVLADIADSLERHTWRRLELMVRMLEPVMLLLLASVVLVVVIALLWPIMKMSTTV